MKVVTICGSMKFKNKMMEVAEQLELEHGYVVIQCLYGNKNYNEKEKDTIVKIHLKKIDISDTIYVVNVGGYIGSDAKREIEYAKKLNKEILYLEPIK